MKLVALFLFAVLLGLSNADGPDTDNADNTDAVLSGAACPMPRRNHRRNHHRNKRAGLPFFDLNFPSFTDLLHQFFKCSHPDVQNQFVHAFLDVDSFMTDDKGNAVIDAISSKQDSVVALFRGLVEKKDDSGTLALITGLMQSNVANKIFGELLRDQSDNIVNVAGAISHNNEGLDNLIKAFLKGEAKNHVLQTISGLLTNRTEAVKKLIAPMFKPENIVALIEIMVELYPYGGLIKRIVVWILKNPETRGMIIDSFKNPQDTQPTKLGESPMPHFPVSDLMELCRGIGIDVGKSRSKAGRVGGTAKSSKCKVCG